METCTCVGGRFTRRRGLAIRKRTALRQGGVLGPMVARPVRYGRRNNVKLIYTYCILRLRARSRLRPPRALNRAARAARRAPRARGGATRTTTVYGQRARARQPTPKCIIRYKLRACKTGRDLRGLTCNGAPRHHMLDMLMLFVNQHHKTLLQRAASSCESSRHVP